MKRILVIAAWLAIAPLAFGVETEKFRSSAPAGALVRYSVTVSAASGDDVESIVAQLAATYGVKLEPADDGAPKRFALIASEARARLLSTDPRVAMVEDWSDPSRVAAASVPGLGDYAYDGAGNITQVGSRTYVYDSVGRLASVSKNGTYEQQYTHDRYGNLLTITTTTASSSTTRLGVNPDTNRIDQNSTNGIPNNMVASYDAFGNITSSPTGSFKYDQFNVIKESTVGGVRSLYLYSASDERIATIQPSLSKELWTLRDSSARVLRRMDRTSGAWNWSQDYIYGAGRLIASAVPTQAKVLHYHHDHLGTPRLITGNGGAQIGQHDYYPFGLELAGSTNDGERLKFTGHERDAATLDYMHARYYDGSMGRFLSVDPTWESADLAKPQTWNRYSYVLNNPINLTDPDGKCGICWDLLDGDTPIFEKGYDPKVSDNPPRSQAEFDQRVRQGRAVRSAVQPYDVGTVDELKAKSVRGDKIDIHHAPQATPAGQVITNYDPAKAPGIAVPEREHEKIPTQKGSYTGTPRDLLAKDVRNLRNHTKAPKEPLHKSLGCCGKRGMS